MSFTGLIPMLWTDKIEETIEFYTGKLNFICEERNDEWGWATMSKDDIEIMFAKPNEHMSFEKPVFSGSFYFRTNDVNGLWEDLKDKVPIVYPIEEFDWNMREFAIYDNNGYMLQFGEEIN